MLYLVHRRSNLIFPMSDTQKDFLHGSNSNSIRPNPHLCFLQVKLVEELFEFGSTLVWNLIGNFRGNFLQFGSFWKFGSQKVVNFVWICVRRFRQDKIISHSISIFQEKTASAALHISFGHDTNSVSQNVGLIHIMCRQDDNPSLLVTFEHLPEATSRGSIHTTRRLIQHYNLGVANKGNRNGKFPLLAPTERIGKLMLICDQFDLIDHLVYF